MDAYEQPTLNLIQCNVYVSRAGRKTRKKKKKKKKQQQQQPTEQNSRFPAIVGSRLGRGSNGQPVLGVEKRPIAS
jgi:hypothetical protein